MAGLKKLDKFVLNNYLWLFCATFFICLFICVMQFLWRYVEDLAGKGLSMEVLFEFFFWASVVMVPMAFPLAILLAALICFGNLGERFELTAMKAAGISLMRIMAPLAVTSLLMAAVSFYFQNDTAPKGQIKMWTLLLSIKQTSPEVDIPEGAFYDQIPGYNLYVKHKNPKTGMLYDVMIYSFANGFADARVIRSDSAQLTVTADKKFLVLDLFHGEMFENLQSQTNAMLRDVPYRREIFRHKVSLIDFNSGFEKMDEGFMSRQYMSKNLKQLDESIDSLNQCVDSMGYALYNLSRTTTYSFPRLGRSDSAMLRSVKVEWLDPDSVFRVSTATGQRNYVAGALTSTQGLNWELRGTNLIDTQRFLWRHEIEWHKKFALSLACIIFFFIGAPLGSIIRKGGIGTPMVVSVLFFVIYFIIDTTGQKMAKEGIWPVWLGVWLSTFVLMPVACFLTYMANRDSTVFNADLYKSAFRRLLGLREERHVMRKEVIIEDPDYAGLLEKGLPLLRESAKAYLEKHGLNRLPGYVRLWRGQAHDEKIRELSEDLERIVENLGNSRDKVLLELLNRYPVLAADAHQSPFRRPWVNAAAGIILPVGLFLYVRISFYRRRLYKDLQQIISVSRSLEQRIAVLGEGFGTEKNIQPIRYEPGTDSEY